VSYSRFQDIAPDVAQEALRLMDAHGVAPHPRNFEIWFNYVSGGMPALRKAIDDLLAAGESFTAERTEKLYSEFFSLLSEGVQVSDATYRLETELDRLVAAFGEAGGNTREFGTALAHFATSLHDSDETDLKAAVGRIVSATDEMRRRNTALEGQLEESLGEIKQLQTDLDQLREEAFTDGLTRIANRKLFDAEMQRLAGEAAAENRDLCLLMLDIDHFKRFNDTFGHQIGDQVLRLLAATVKECVKGRDIPARYGGEEFAIILPDTSLENALKLAESVRRAIGEKKVINKNTHEDLGRITVSIGAGQLAADESA